MEDTTVNVTFQSNTFTDLSSGMFLDNVKNIKLVNNNLDSEFNAAIYISASSNINLTENNFVRSPGKVNYNILKVANSKSVRILNNSFDRGGRIEIQSSNFITIQNNLITTYTTGITLYGSNHVLISHNMIKSAISAKGGSGIELTNNAKFNTITQNDIEFGLGYSIEVNTGSNSNIFKENKITNKKGSDYGIYSIQNMNNTFIKNQIKGNAEGIYLSQLTNTTVDQNHINTSSFSIYLRNSPKIKIFNNTLFSSFYTTGTNDTMRYVQNLENNTVNGLPIYQSLGDTGKTITGNYGQVFLIDASSVTLDGLSISGIDYAVTTINSSSITIQDGYFYGKNGTVSTVSIGIKSSLTITNTKMDNGGVSIKTQQSSLSTISIDTSTVNNKPLLYAYNQVNRIYSDDYGQIFVVESSNIEIKHQEMDNVFSGIDIRFSYGIIVSENHFNQVGHGVKVEGSDNITITDNEITKTKFAGIWGYDFSYPNSNISIMRNHISYGDQVAIFANSEVNIIKQNYISMYELGIFLSNTITTSIITNTIEKIWDIGLYISSSPYTEIKWNNFILSDGNSQITLKNSVELDYNFYSYIELTDGDDDGILDTPHSIGSNTDDHPLSRQYILFSPNIIDIFAVNDTKVMVTWTPAGDNYDTQIETSILYTRTPEIKSSWIEIDGSIDISNGIATITFDLDGMVDDTIYLVIKSTTADGRFVAYSDQIWFVHSDLPEYSDPSKVPEELPETQDGLSLSTVSIIMVITAILVVTRSRNFINQRYSNQT